MTEKYAWQPTAYWLQESRIALFMQKYGICEGDWRELLRCSLDLDWFYPAMFEAIGLEWFTPYQTLCDDSSGMPFTKWFLGGKTNITHNCIERHLRDGHGENIALIYEDEASTSVETSYAELNTLINRIATVIKGLGVKKGDRIAMCMTMSPESVALMLACFKIGVVCVQIAPSSSISEILSHVQTTGSKIIFMVQGYSYKWQWHDSRKILEELSIRSQVQDIIVLQNSHRVLYIADPEKITTWNDFISNRDFLHEKETEHTEYCDSEDIALILFSSGTTGVSKCIVHTYGSILAQVPKEVGFVFDCQRSDVFFWVTQFGWMMAPWEIIGAMFFGASVLICDGSPFFPEDRLFRLIERHQVTIFGFTPAGIRGMRAACEENFYAALYDYDLSSLRILASTGDVLGEKDWLWYFRTLGKDRLPVLSIWGGTEVIGCLGYPLPIMPLKSGTVGNHALGIHTKVWDENGQPVLGVPGNAVVTLPFPSMTRGFYADTERYLAAYFEKFGRNTWSHGDRILEDKDGYWFHTGRGDDLIIRNGIKFDPSRIANDLIALAVNPRIVDVAAISIPDEKIGQRIVVFVVLIAGDDDAINTISGHWFREVRDYLKKSYDSRLTLDVLHIVSVIPRNRAGKIPSSLIRRSYLGEEIGESEFSKVVNPESLLEIQALGMEERK